MYTYIDVVIAAVAEQQDNVPPSKRTEMSGDDDTAIFDLEGASENGCDWAAATLPTPVSRTITVNPPGSREGHLIGRRWR